MTASAPDRDGRVPFRLRVGVTGHRTLSGEASLGKAVSAAIERIKALVPGPRLASTGRTPVLFTAVSPIAEGADRLVARTLIQEFDADLEVPLPLAVDDYRQDFDSQASKAEFDELLSGASTCSQAPMTRTRNEAYELAGRYVVDRSDVLIALWDHDKSRGRGGTAEIVEYAHRHAVPMLVIDTSTADVTEELGPREAWLEELRQEWRRVNAYNWARVRHVEFRAAVHEHEQALVDLAKAAGLVPSSGRRLADWLSPYLARAGLLARHCHDLYLRLTAAVFLLAALAVITVASQVLLAPDVPELAFVELALLGALLAIVGFGRWSKINRRFICDRFLAERLREASFLVLAGLDRPRRVGFKRGYLGRRSEGWPWRAFADIWHRRPTGADVTVTDASTLQQVVTEQWIDGQISYHERTAEKNHRLQRLVLSGSVVLLSATIVTAGLHAAGVGGHDTSGATWASVLVLVSIAVPALGGALSGIGAQREYARHAERSERMSEYLSEARADVLAAEGLDSVRETTSETAELFLAENRDWFGVLSFRDLEPHA